MVKISTLHTIHCLTLLLSLEWIKFYHLWLLHWHKVLAAEHRAGEGWMFARSARWLRMGFVGLNIEGLVFAQPIMSLCIIFWLQIIVVICTILWKFYIAPDNRQNWNYLIKCFGRSIYHGGCDIAIAGVVVRVGHHGAHVKVVRIIFIIFACFQIPTCSRPSQFQNDYQALFFQQFTNNFQSLKFHTIYLFENLLLRESLDSAR